MAVFLKQVALTLPRWGSGARPGLGQGQGRGEVQVGLRGLVASPGFGRELITREGEHPAKGKGVGFILEMERYKE